MIAYQTNYEAKIREVKIPRFRCTWRVAWFWLAIFSSISVPLLVIKVHIFRIISLSIARKQKTGMIELQTSVKQDDTSLLVPVHRNRGILTSLIYLKYGTFHISVFVAFSASCVSSCILCFPSTVLTSVVPRSWTSCFHHSWWIYLKQLVVAESTRVREFTHVTTTVSGRRLNKLFEINDCMKMLSCI
jgi:hypothetical protein